MLYADVAHGSWVRGVEPRYSIILAIFCHIPQIELLRETLDYAPTHAIHTLWHRPLLSGGIGKDDLFTWRTTGSTCSMTRPVWRTIRTSPYVALRDAARGQRCMEQGCADHVHGAPQRAQRLRGCDV